MTQLYFGILLAGLLAGSYPTLAQQGSPPISGDFRNLRFEQFAQRVEAQTPFRFYFDPAALDSVTVQVQADGLPLVAVLRQIFEHSSLRFATDEATNRIFITTEYPLQTRLPDEFFPAAPASGSPPPVITGGSQAPARTSRPAEVGTSEFRVYEIGPRQAAPAGNRATITGVVRTSKEPVPGVAVFIDSPNIGTATDAKGAYSLTLPVGRYNLNIRGLGIRPTRRQIWVHANGRLDLEVLSDVTSLREVVVQGQKEGNVRGMQMGVQKLDIKVIKQVPTVFGEADILRVVTALPGVKTIGEGSTGFSVRGGGTALLEEYELLQAPREFYAPRYDTEALRRSRLPDLRNLLYWNPAVNLTANNPQTLDFFTSDQAGRYLVVAQGMTPDGHLGSTSFAIEVKPTL